MISEDSLRAVDNHWAVLAVSEEERNRGLKVSDALLVKRAVGQQMQLDFFMVEFQIKFPPILLRA